jgi:hypothetical protein
MRCSALQCASPSGEHPHLCNPNASTERGSDMRRLLTHLRRARRVRDVTNVPIKKFAPGVTAGGFFVSGDATALATNSRLGGYPIRRRPADVLTLARALSHFPLSIPQIGGTAG